MVKAISKRAKTTFVVLALAGSLLFGQGLVFQIATGDTAPASSTIVVADGGGTGNPPCSC